MRRAFAAPNWKSTGGNTTIAISGKYAANVPSFGGFAAPNGDYTITFTLPQDASTASGFVSFPTPGSQCGFNINADLTFDLNNSATTTTFTGVTLNFFDTLS